MAQDHYYERKPCGKRRRHRLWHRSTGNKAGTRGAIVSTQTQKARRSTYPSVDDKPSLLVVGTTWQLIRFRFWPLEEAQAQSHTPERSTFAHHCMVSVERSSCFFAWCRANNNCLGAALTTRQKVSNLVLKLSPRSLPVYISHCCLSHSCTHPANGVVVREMVLSKYAVAFQFFMYRAAPPPPHLPQYGLTY